MSKLKKLSMVTCILQSIMKDAPGVMEINPAAKCEQMSIAVDDTDQEDLLSRFQEAIDYINKARDSGGSILVHCMQGVSRSATVRLFFGSHIATDDLKCFSSHVKPVSPHNVA